MNEDELIEKFGIEFAISNIALSTSKKIDEYKKNKSNTVKIELARLLIDKEKIYRNDKEVIKKYLKGYGDK